MYLFVFRYYRFDLFREKSQDEFYKISLKFMTSAEEVKQNSLPNDLFTQYKLVIFSIDPRKESSLEILDAIDQYFLSMFEKYEKEEVEKSDEDEKDNNYHWAPKYLRLSSLRKLVLIVVNHWDNDNRVIGTDSILKRTQKYNFGLVELSSVSGVNLEFLMSHIVDLLIDEKEHDQMETSNFIETYTKERTGGYFHSFYSCIWQTDEKVPRVYWLYVNLFQQQVDI